MLRVGSVQEAKALLELSHKYEMPGLLESLQEYLLPGAAPWVKVRHTHLLCFNGSPLCEFSINVPNQRGIC